MPHLRLLLPRRPRYTEAEKTNGRWAMMAVAGILGQELLGVQPTWWEAGAKDYGVPMAPLLAMEFLVRHTCNSSSSSSQCTTAAAAAATAGVDAASVAHNCAAEGGVVFTEQMTAGWRG